MIGRAALAMVVLGGLPGAAWGQSEVVLPVAATAACMAQEPGAACIGLGARACVAQRGPGSAGICLGAENAWWVQRIEAARADLRAREAEGQARAARRGTPVPTLDQVRQAFEAYRDAACGWQVAQWEGMHTGPVEMDCVMRLNAQQALWLEARMQDR